MKRFTWQVYILVMLLQPQHILNRNCFLQQKVFSAHSQTYISQQTHHRLLKCMCERHFSSSHSYWRVFEPIHDESFEENMKISCWRQSLNTKGTNIPSKHLKKTLYHLLLRCVQTPFKQILFQCLEPLIIHVINVMQ